MRIKKGLSADSNCGELALPSAGLSAQLRLYTVSGQRPAAPPSCSRSRSDVEVGPLFPVREGKYAPRDSGYKMFAMFGRRWKATENALFSWLLATRQGFCEFL